jgi:hypothetical protein
LSGKGKALGCDVLARLGLVLYREPASAEGQHRHVSTADTCIVESAGQECASLRAARPLAPALQALAGGKPASDVYGGEHLVRLLVKLPELLPVATMGPQVG